MVTKVGNLRVYCNGKIFVGPDWKSLFVSFLLIFLPSLLYLSLIAAEMGPDVFWLGCLLIMFNLAMLALTGLSNPGVIPRRPAPSGPSARMVPSIRTKDYKINGYTISTKYCTTCQIYRVPRCSHCAMSDNCVEKFDHYCPWVGTCIGRRNYRFFLMFVFSGTVLCLLVCATSLSRLVEISGDNDDEFDTAVKREPVAIVLVIYTFGAVWFVGGLSAFHTYLVLTNQTTYEHIRRRFGQHGNPYDKGIFMNLFEACCKPNPPYDWESDSYQVQSAQDTSRPMELPAGVVLNPTVIAMQQAAREQAERARANSQRGSDTGSCNYTGDVFRDNPTALNEYQDSLYSSSSSVEVRRPGMTSQRLPQRLSTYAAFQKATAEQECAESEITQEDAQDDKTEVSSGSLDQRSSRRSLGDVGFRRPSISGMSPCGGKEFGRHSNNVEKRHSRHLPAVRGDSAHTNVSRAETEMVNMKSAGRRTTNPFAYPEESVHTDSGQLDIATTLSSLTSNATSEVSSHRTDRSDFHARKPEKHNKNRHRVMSMQEIMSSQHSIPDLHLGRKNSGHQDRRRHGSCGEVNTAKRFGSDGFAGFRVLRASGEQVFNNIKALMKKPSRDSKEPSEQTPDVDIMEAVFVNIEEAPQDLKEEEPELIQVSEGHAHDDTTQEDAHTLRTWAPQLPPLSQQKYTELKETPPTPFEGSVNEDAPSHEVHSANSASRANNAPTETLSVVESSVQLKETQDDNEKDVETFFY